MIEAFSYIKPIRIQFPNKKPSKPFGPTSLEVLKSCALRNCFEISEGFEKRLGFAARIGSAYHQTLESFYKYPISRSTVEETIAEARERFQRNIKKQIEISKNHPREVGLPQDHERIDRACEAILMQARKYYEEKESGVHYWHREGRNTQNGGKPKEDKVGLIEVEAPVESKDGVFKGRIDRIEHREDGAYLFDFKSALRDDLPGRYERQLQLYAYLFHETRGAWPNKAYVIYPLAVSTHEVIIEPNTCKNTAKEYLALLQQVEKEKQFYKLALPGEVCQVCDYRPWCAPFWNWQNKEENPTAVLENAYWGAMGHIDSIKIIDFYVQLILNWRNAKIQVICPKERFPQLEKAKVGQTISLLEAKLKGLRHQPKAIITPRTELFLYREK